MKHLGTQVFKTQRLILRPFVAQDVDDVFSNWASDTHVTPFLTWQTHQDISTTQAILQQWIKQYQDPSFYQWNIVLRSLNASIGTISLVEIHKDIGKVQIGYCLGSQWWHQGYASEALKTIIPFLFQCVHVNRIESYHDVNNPRSGLVLKKCGLQYEGTMKMAARNNRGIVDICMYGLTIQDFHQKEKIL